MCSHRPRTDDPKLGGILRQDVELMPGFCELSNRSSGDARLRIFVVDRSNQEARIRKILQLEPVSPIVVEILPAQCLVGQRCYSGGWVAIEFGKEVVNFSHTIFYAQTLGIGERRMAVHEMRLDDFGYWQSSVAGRCHEPGFNFRRKFQ